MDPEYHEQLQKLQQFRRSLIEQNKRNGTVSSASEFQPDANSGQYELGIRKTALGSSIENEPLDDPLIFPGLYAPSGIDMMGILVRVRTRPNPVIDIGNIDSSVALVLCDTAVPDLPIVYCSEPFEFLTGYSSSEVLGRNCRFLQRPYRNPLLPTNEAMAEAEHIADHANQKPRFELRGKISKGEEAQVRLVNYTKSGEKFFNLLTTIPITWDEGDMALGLRKRYIVGFQAQDPQLR